MKLRPVDLFSGIGGLHKALANIVKPVAVCDTNKVCRTILSFKTPSQCLVHLDVKKLSLIPLAGTIDIIIASSPCQGFSSLGSHKGLTDERSLLLLEVLRLINEAQPKAIFLENVPGAIKYAMPSLIDELGNKRAYELRWACVLASHVETPHRRLRWFCLAILSEMEWEFKNLHYKRYDWTQEPRHKEDCHEHLRMYLFYAQRL
jgi:DNA (cytosine-5)-methyltransferase 1